MNRTSQGRAPRTSRWVMILGAVTLGAGASLFALDRDRLVVQGINPAEQRRQMITLLRSIDARLGRLQETLEQVSKKLPRSTKSQSTKR